MSKDAVQALYEAECEMALQSRVQEDTADARNAVESYVYTLRNRLGDSLGKFVTPDKRDSIVAALETAENWLYDEGEDLAKSAYVAKLGELHALGAPVEARAREAEARPAEVSDLRSLCQSYLAAGRSGDAKYSHLSEDELSKCGGEAESALSWLGEKEAL